MVVRGAVLLIAYGGLDANAGVLFMLVKQGLRLCGFGDVAGCSHYRRDDAAAVQVRATSLRPERG